MRILKCGFAFALALLLSAPVHAQPFPNVPELDAAELIVRPGILDFGITVSTFFECLLKLRCS
jgi:hypothetical protein